MTMQAREEGGIAMEKKCLVYFLDFLATDFSDFLYRKTPSG